MSEPISHYESPAAWRAFVPAALPVPAARAAMRALPPISAIVLTKNSAALLRDVLNALRWCDEIVVFDTGSTDDTPMLARQCPRVSFHRLEGPFLGFGRVRRQAIALARHDWILSIDSDEIVTPELAAEISRLPLDPQVVYAMPFHNYFNGRRITSCGWDPDRHERLFNRTATNFCESELHEKVQTMKLGVQLLRHPIRHYSYGSLADFLHKMKAYSQLFAEQHAGRKTSGVGIAVARSVWAFGKSYVLQRGCLEGGEGFVISVYKTQLVFWKYLLLHEANRRRGA